MKCLILFLLYPFVAGKFIDDLTDIEDVPYTVAVLIDTKTRFIKLGNGAVLTKKHVATTAILEDNNSYLIRAGSTQSGKGGSLINVEKYLKHPKYDSNHYTFDYGLMILAKQLEFSDTIQPVSLATEDSPDNSKLTISGWYNNEGKYNNFLNNLRSSEGYKFSHLVCISDLDYQYLIHDNMGCTGDISLSRGTCFAEMGGPVVQNRTLYGLVASQYGCTNIKPAVYNRISVVHSWYNETIEASLNHSTIVNCHLFIFLITLTVFIQELI